MKLLTDILKTIHDGLFILALVLAVAGFELSERPWYEPEEMASLCKFPCPEPPPIYQTSAGEISYEWIRKESANTGRWVMRIPGGGE